MINTICIKQQALVIKELVLQLYDKAKKKGPYFLANFSVVHTIPADRNALLQAFFSCLMQ